MSNDEPKLFYFGVRFRDRPKHQPKDLLEDYRRNQTINEEEKGLTQSYTNFWVPFAWSSAKLLIDLASLGHMAVYVAFYVT